MPWASFSAFAVSWDESAFEAAVGPGVRAPAELHMDADERELVGADHVPGGGDAGDAAPRDAGAEPALRRASGLVVPVGRKKTIAIAVRNASGRRSWSKPDEWLAGAKDDSEARSAGDARSLGERPLTGAMPYG